MTPDELAAYLAVLKASGLDVRRVVVEGKGLIDLAPLPVMDAPLRDDGGGRESTVRGIAERLAVVFPNGLG